MTRFLSLLKSLSPSFLELLLKIASFSLIYYPDLLVSGGFAYPSSFLQAANFSLELDLFLLRFSLVKPHLLDAILLCSRLVLSFSLGGIHEQFLSNLKVSLLLGGLLHNLVLILDEGVIS